MFGPATSAVSESAKSHAMVDKALRKSLLVSTNYGFIIYTQVRMTKLLVMLSVAVKYMYGYMYSYH